MQNVYLIIVEWLNVCLEPIIAVHEILTFLQLHLCTYTIKMYNYMCVCVFVCVCVCIRMYIAMP